MSQNQCTTDESVLLSGFSRVFRVTVFETGTNRWRRFDQWPPAGDTMRLYLQPDGGLAFDPPGRDTQPTEYVSDPAKPVPFAPRPIWAGDYSNPAAVAKWQRWLVEDQRFHDLVADTKNGI